MADNEDSTATLGDSGKLSVERSVGEPIPAFDHEPEEGREGSSGVIRQNSGDVLPNHPTGAESASKEKKFDGQVTTWIIQSRSLSCDGECLARGASNENINWSMLWPDLGEVAEVGNAGVVMREHARGELGDLREPLRHEPLAVDLEVVPRSGDRLDPAAHAAVGEGHRRVILGKARW
jgi:hypothetical protein